LIIVISGLPGAGKTALAKEIIRRTNAIHLNADDVREELSSDLGFGIEDRLEQARRMGSVARLLSNQNHMDRAHDSYAWQVSALARGSSSSKKRGT
jgi:adenylylsulfate kinase-like enzyme